VGLHQAWASRRAWRVRARLLGLLALAAWLLRPWMGGWVLLIPLLGLLYPSKREEARALAEIDRKLGLAYRTALETPTSDPQYERLQHEAEKQVRAAALPRLPWAELLLAAAVWLAAVLAPVPQTTPAAKPLQQEVSSPGDGAEPAPGNHPGSPSTTSGDDRDASPQKTPSSQGAAAPENATQPGKDGQETPAHTEEVAPATADSGERGGKNGAGRQQESSAKNTPAGLDQEGRKAAGSSGELAGSDRPPVAAPAVDVPAPEAPAELPQPWPAGTPPAEVKQAAERYIENNPLPPGAAEALKRYFELEE